MPKGFPILPLTMPLFDLRYFYVKKITNFHFVPVKFTNFGYFVGEG